MSWCNKSKWNTRLGILRAIKGNLHVELNYNTIHHTHTHTHTHTINRSNIQKFAQEKGKGHFLVHSCQRIFEYIRTNESSCCRWSCSSSSCCSCSRCSRRRSRCSCHCNFCTEKKHKNWLQCSIPCLNNLHSQILK